MSRTLLWLGAGDGSFLECVTSNALDKIVLVEAEDIHQAALKALQKEDPRIQIHHKIVAKKSGTETQYQYNNNEFNSLVLATGLHQLFPGLVLLDEKNVTVFGINELINEIDMDINGDNRLILSIPAQSLELLQVLYNNHQLQFFSELTVQVGTIQLYRDAAIQAEIEHWLELHGYEKIAEDFTDPDLPKLSFQKNQLAFELREINKLYNQLVERNEELTIEKLAFQQMLNEEKESLSNLKINYHADLQQKNSLNQQLQNDLNQAQKDLIKMKSDCSELSMQLKSEQARNAEANKRLNQVKLEFEQQLTDSKQQTKESKSSQIKATELLSLQQAGFDQLTEVHKMLVEEHSIIKLALESSQVDSAKYSELCTTLRAQLQQSVDDKNKCEQQLLKLKEQYAAIESSSKQMSEQYNAQKAQVEQNEKTVQALQQRLTANESSLKQIAEQNVVLKTQLEQNDRSRLELQQLLEKSKSDLTTMTKQAATRLDKINQLEKVNRQTLEINQQLNRRQQTLEQEMLKAEAQIDIIKELILKD